MVDQFVPNPSEREQAEASSQGMSPLVEGDAVETTPELQAELETLGALLREPVSEEEARYLAESGCRRVRDLVAAIGRTPNETTAHQAASAGDLEEQSTSAEPAFQPRDLGQYRLLAPLGQGGMGTVYKAIHLKLEKVVALKVLPADKMQDAAAVARFEREMKAVGNLDHPNIVRAFDAGEVEGTHFLVMEHIAGMDLSTLSHRLGPIAIVDACEVVRQAAAGLQYAHERGLVHRDIKPSNLMLTPDGQVKILDLGLALLDPLRATGGSELTSSGQMMGTLDYMAPEQGSDSHTVDIRADIYSLGATLYRLLCGEAPFAGGRYDTPLRKMLALATESPAPIRQRRPSVPADLAALVDRMLAKDPGDRFATPAELAAAIEPFCGGSNLAVLLSVADQVPVEAPADGRTATTEARLTSASHATDPYTVRISPHLQSAGRRPTASWPFGPAPSSGGLRSRRRLVALALLPLAFLLGIVVWVNRTRIELPDGASVTVKPDGAVEVKLPGQQAAESAAVQPKGERATAAEAPTESNRWIDLLPLVDLKQDVFAGSFEALGRTFQCKGGLLRLPVRVEGDYQLEVTFYREQDAEVAVIFPVAADRHVALGFKRGEAAPSVGGDRRHDLNSSLLIPLLPANGKKEHTARITVHMESAAVAINVELDDGVVATWSGNPKQLRVWHGDGHYPRVPEPSFGLLVEWQNPPRASFSSARLHMLSGKAEPGARLGLTAGKPIQVEPQTVDLTAEPRKVQPGQPISGTALVSRPTRIPELRSWTVDTRGHRGTVLDVEYSPDGRWLASAGRDGTIRILDAKTEQLARVLYGHVGAVKSLAWSPEGKTLASAGEDGALRYWDVAAGRLLRSVTPEDSRFGNLEWSPTGTTIAYVTTKRQIGLWDVAKGCVAQVFDKPGGQYLAWSPDGKRLASTVCHNSMIHVHDAASGKRVATLDLHRPAGDGLAWSPDGNTILVPDVFPSNKMSLYDARSGKLRYRVAADHPAFDPKFSPDGSFFACSTWQGCAIDLFETRAGRRIGHYSDDSIYGTSGYLAWSPDGKKLAIGAHGGCVRSIAPGAVEREHSRLNTRLEGFMGIRDFWPASRPSWSPDGSEIALMLQQAKVRLRTFNVANLDAPRRAVELHPESYACVWSPDGARIVALGNPSIVWSRDLTKQLGRVEGDFQGAWRPWPRLSPSGRLLAVANGANYRSDAAVFDMQTGQTSPIKSREENRSIAWSPDEKVLVLGKKDGRLVFYDVAAKKILEGVKRHESMVHHLAFSPNGRWLASAAEDGTLQLADASTRQPVGRRAMDERATALAFSPDSSVLACADQQTCHLLELKFLKTVHQLEGRADRLAFSPDGKTLLGIGADGGRRRWDTASGKLLAADVAHPTDCDPRNVAWSPDCRYVAAWAAGLALHVWRTADAQPMGVVGMLNDDILYVSPEGHCRTTLDYASKLVYVALTESGEQKLFTPAEFEKQYGWTNDPAKVQPLVDPQP